MKEGAFITFEGGEGAGKTTILHLIQKKLSDLGYDILITREPGGIEISEKIRQVILDPAHTKMEGRTEVLLYAAARRQHLVEKILPALQTGKIVICDRFIDSSLAYQGHARGLGIDEVLTINRFAIEDFMPTMTIYFDIEPEQGLKRVVNNEQREKNRLDLETIHFHELVYEGYKILLNRYSERIRPVNANQPLQRVEEDVFKLILAHLERK